jgi:hypothetical protein
VVPNEVLFRTNLTVSAEGLAVTIEHVLGLPSPPLTGPSRVVNGTVREITLIFASANASSSAVELAQSGQLPGVVSAVALAAPPTSAPTSAPVPPSGPKTGMIVGIVVAVVAVIAGVTYFIYQRIRGGMWEGLPREQQADGGCLVDEVLVQRGTEEEEDPGSGAAYAQGASESMEEYFFSPFPFCFVGALVRELPSAPECELRVVMSHEALCVVQTKF